MFKKLITLGALALASATGASAQCCICAQSYYTGASALFGWNNDFHTAGGAAHVGFMAANDLGVEFEAGVLGGWANETHGLSATSKVKNKARLVQVPLMVNVRYVGAYDCVSYYAGAGLGVNIYSGHVDAHTSTFTGAAETTAKERVDLLSSSNVSFAGQLFAGLGYALTPNFSVGAGARMLFARQFHMIDKKSNEAIFTTSSVIPMVEATVSYAF